MRFLVCFLRAQTELAAAADIRSAGLVCSHLFEVFRDVSVSVIPQWSVKVFLADAIPPGWEPFSYFTTQYNNASPSYAWVACKRAEKVRVESE